MEKRGPVVRSTIVRQNVGSSISRLLVVFSTQTRLPVLNDKWITCRARQENFQIFRSLVWWIGLSIRSTKVTHY